MEGIGELIEKIESARSSIVGSMPSVFWICFWLFAILWQLCIITNKLDIIIELAK